MKNTPLVLLLYLVSVTCLAQLKDEVVIEKIIIDETDAFIKLNYDKEISYFAHKPYTTRSMRTHGRENHRIQ